MEYEASVLRSIHSSGELRGELRGPTTCSDPVGIVDWGGVLAVVKHMHTSGELPE